MKAIKHKIGQVMPSAGGEALINDPYHQRFEYTNYTEVDIFTANQPLWARLDLEDKSLPGKLIIKCKRDTYADKFEKKLPEDLRIYFSLNTKEPTEGDCDQKICKEHIEKMNHNKDFNVIFGREQARETAKYPEYVYMTFETKDRPIALYMKY